MDVEAKRTDYVCAVVAALALLLAIGAVVEVVWQVLRHNAWHYLVTAPIAVALYWWIGLGAWRRTVWARRT